MKIPRFQMCRNHIYEINMTEHRKNCALIKWLQLRVSGVMESDTKYHPHRHVRQMLKKDTKYQIQHNTETTDEENEKGAVGGHI